MNNKILFALSLYALVTCPFTFASEIESSTGLGVGTLNQGFIYKGTPSDKKSKGAKDSAAPEKEPAAPQGEWNWALGYNYTETTLGSTSTSASGSGAKDHTNTVTAGAGYSDRWEAGVDFNYSNTKEENLHNFGFNPYLGYTFDLSDNEDFTPTLNLRFTAGVGNYTQDATTVVRVGSRRKVTAAVGAATIQQSKFEMDALLSALSWVDLKLVYIKYNYNKDVNAFLARLDQPRAIVTGAANFGSTLNGFSTNEATAELTFHLPVDIDFTAGFTQATAATDSAKLNTYELDALKSWGEHFKTGVGFSRSKSTTDLQSITTLTLDYDF